MKKRWIVGGVLAVLLGVSATGVAVNAQWLEGRWDASHAAGDLQTHLQKLEGVTKATATYNPFGLPDPTVVATVVFAVDAPPAQWGAATTLIRSAAASRALNGTTSTAVFSQAASTSVTVEPMFFTPQTVAAEIAAWRQLRQAVGDRVSLLLGPESGWTQPPGPIVREYDVQNEADARQVADLWPDTAPLVDPAIPTVWKGPGLQWSAMPSKALMTSLSAVGAALPLASADPATKQTGTFAVILSWFDGYKVTLLSLRDGELTSGRPTEGMARAAQAAFATGARGVEWDSSHIFAGLLSGSCPVTQTAHTTFFHLDNDDKFAADLAGLGFVQPPDVRAGGCTT